MIRIEDLHVRGGDHAIVLDADLDFEPGEVTLIVGPSGAGKTSLLEALAGTGSWNGLDVSCRRLDTEGEPAASSGRHALHGSIVFQNAALYDELTVSQNLGLVASGKPTIDPRSRAEVDKLMNGIAPDKLPNLMSGGQRQRVAIAQSLYAGDTLILMDEPNAGLDMVRTDTLIETIRRITETGRHVVISAHHPAPFLPLCSRVLFLDGEGGLTPIEAADIAGIQARFADNRINANGGPAPAPAFSVSGKNRAYWFAEFLMRELWSLMFAPSNLLYIGTACALLAFTTAYVAVASYPFPGLLLDLTIEQLVASLGDAYYRFTVPLIVSILVAARSSALVTTDLAMKSMTGATPALRQFGVPIDFYRGGCVVLALSLSTLLLYGVGIVAAFYAIALAIGVVTHEKIAFLQAVVVSDIVGGTDQLEAWQWILLKTLASGAVVGLISLSVGNRRLTSGRDITAAASLAVLLSVLAVIALHAAIIFLELKL